MKITSKHIMVSLLVALMCLTLPQMSTIAQSSENQGIPDSIYRIEDRLDDIERRLRDTDTKTVFVTSPNSFIGGGLTGALGGLVGADKICNSLAAEANLPGDYKAWLSDSRASPQKRFNQTTKPYVLVDGTLIANGWNDLIDLVINHPIDLDQTGVQVIDRNVWTNTREDGIEIGFNCSDWTSDTVSPGTTGTTSRQTSGWSSYQGRPCGELHLLYCFQQ